MNIILIFVVIILLFGVGGFYGVQQGHYGGLQYGGSLGVLLLVLILFLLFR